MPSLKRENIKKNQSIISNLLLLSSYGKLHVFFFNCLILTYLFEIR